MRKLRLSEHSYGSYPRFSPISTSIIFLIVPPSRSLEASWISSADWISYSYNSAYLKTNTMCWPYFDTIFLNPDFLKTIDFYLQAMIFNFIFKSLQGDTLFNLQTFFTGSSKFHLMCPK